ncbi:recombinase family protein [Halalkalibacter sp. APA_J-10(15)]|uniref:recombinase family protein n=1 Tax=Halalkalibacter sp. APA_J-10(15) TaxID=2933805 RepID=UPI0027E544E0|nr:recombinase family protein [Halalkalibacter sp. APA_J-10(15)]MCK0471438.1 recombinase family protein [Halalkalibacter sp. APA_J-10(15)]
MFTLSCAIYVRVSTEEQVKEGFSISAQLERLRAFAHSQGWEVTHEYVEEGWSAKNIKRPQLQKMLSDLKENEFNVILVYKLDRLTRSVIDLYTLLKDFEDHNVSFRSATEVYDTSTAMGRLFITLVAALAQWEREQLVERVKVGLEQMVDEGKKPGTQNLFGYRFDVNFKCEIIEEEAEIVRWMFQLYADGYGYRAIADKLNERGINTKRTSMKWGTSSVRLILKNDMYIGIFRYGDKVKYNTHPPIINEVLFHQVQKRMNSKQLTDSRKGKLTLTGLLKCGHCNEHGMNGNYDKRDQIVYYRCSKCNRSASENKIVDLILKELEKMITSKEYFLSLITNSKDDEQDYIELKKELEAIIAQKNKALDLYMDENSPFDKDELYARTIKLNEREQELLLQMDNMDVDFDSPEMKYDKIKNLTGIVDEFHRAEPMTKKELLENIFEKIIYIREKKGRHSPINLEYFLK